MARPVVHRSLPPTQSMPLPSARLDGRIVRGAAQQLNNEEPNVSRGTQLVTEDTFVLNAKDSKYILFGNNRSLTFIGGSNDTVVIVGNDDQVNMFNNKNATIDDIG